MSDTVSKWHEMQEEKEWFKNNPPKKLNAYQRFMKALANLLKFKI